MWLKWQTIWNDLFDGDNCGVWHDWGCDESGWKREWLRRNDEISHDNEQINDAKWHDNVVTGNKIVANTIIAKYRNGHEDGDDGDAPQPLSSPLSLPFVNNTDNDGGCDLCHDVNKVTDDDAVVTDDADDVDNNVVMKHRKMKKEPKAVHGGHKHL